MNSILDVRDGTHDSPKYVVDGIPFVTSKCLKNGDIDFSICNSISFADAEKINKRSNVDDKDILFAMIGTIGNPVIVNKTREFSIKNVALIKNIDRYNLNEKWIKSVLECLSTNMQNTTSSGLQPFVSLEFLRNYIIPVPPYKKQKLTLSIVDSIFDKLFKVSALCAEIHVTKENLKNKILDSIFCIDSSYKSYYEKGYTIENDTEILDNLRKPINATEREQRLNKSKYRYPYYGATGQVGFINEYLIDGEYVLVGEDGAPFLDKYKRKAYIINGKSWVNNHAHILKSNSNNKFLMYYLNWFNYQDYVSGTTRLKLTQGNLRKIPFINISKVEKDIIVEKLDKIFESIDNM